MTRMDLVDITHIDKATVKDCLEEFVDAGFILSKKERYKMRIYLCFYHLTEFVIKDHTRTKPIIVFKEYDENEYPFAKKKIVRERIQKNPLPGYPDYFIASVFRLFKFNDPKFKEDIRYFRKNRDKMRALKYFHEGDDDFPGDKKILDSLLDAYEKSRSTKKL